MSRRFQFSLKTLLVAMLVVAAFFGGMVVQKRLDRPNSWVIMRARMPSAPETIMLSDGTTWYRTHPRDRLPMGFNR
jgi:hypothetical protein